MGDSWFKQWLAVRKQVAFLIPILLLALAFAVVVIVGRQSPPDRTANAILIVRDGKRIHCFEVNTRTKRVVTCSTWEQRTASTTPPATPGNQLQIRGESLISGAKGEAGQALVSDPALGKLGPGATILAWGLREAR